jgi:hypothetical protein
MQTRIQKSKPGPKNPNKVVRTIDNPSDAVIFDRESMWNQCVVRCPVCGGNYTHAQGVYTLLGGDESGGLYRGSYLVARETDYRRDALAIRVEGETCGHRWDIVFQQHKGQTFTRIDILETTPGTDGEREREY